MGSCEHGDEPVELSVGNSLTGRMNTRFQKITLLQGVRC